MPTKLLRAFVGRGDGVVSKKKAFIDMARDVSFIFYHPSSREACEGRAPARGEGVAERSRSTEAKRTPEHADPND
ncbi:hypothetical protein JCM31826_15550 [Thermaurantimonas aggregans]|uniref:Uncharacterized protein n=1 Tax=Thermaurantimonas aggregans TaxID=2173829 RepID=A0A401XM37_9FLAO|nr:hypothetical protein JCM31826_15550 [Thermaurantimonas aggregans]